VIERPVGGVRLEREQGLHPFAGGREQREVALGAEGAARGLHQVLGHRVQRDEVDGARGGEVAELDVVGPLEGVHLVDGLGNQEVEIGVALTVGVRAQVHRHAVDEERDVGAVIGVEAPQEILLGLASALMLAQDQARHEAEDIPAGHAAAARSRCRVSIVPKTPPPVAEP
jgi:hypothetical protein